MKAQQARVLLTGATGGIGREAAAALVGAGASVMLAGRSPARLADQARLLAAHRPDAAQRVQWSAGDLGEPQQLAALAATAAQWGCNVVVHNAGVPSFGRLASLSPEHMQQVLQTNLLVPMLLTQALLPQLLRQQRAQVICIGSALGRIGLPGYSVYSASKFGLRGFAEALRRELQGGPVRVQYLGPRTTDTGFNSASVQEYNHATGTASDTPAFVAQALLQLLQDETAERFLGFPEKLAVRVNALVPTWLDAGFAKHRRSLPTAAAATAGQSAALDFIPQDQGIQP